MTGFPSFTSDLTLIASAASAEMNFNRIVAVARDGQFLSGFSAGAVDLNGVDATDKRGADPYRTPDRAQTRTRCGEMAQHRCAGILVERNDGALETGQRSGTSPSAELASAGEVISCEV